MITLVISDKTYELKTTIGVAAEIQNTFKKPLLEVLNETSRSEDVEKEIAVLKCGVPTDKRAQFDKDIKDNFGTNELAASYISFIQALQSSDISVSWDEIQKKIQLIKARQEKIRKANETEIEKVIG